MRKTNVDRRQFLGATVASSFAFTFVPSTAFGANDRVAIGCIGIGGKGQSDVSGLAGAGGQIVALCDVDEKRRVKKGQDPTILHPDARFYADFREMLATEGDKIDAVSVSTPDHVHCVASVNAMRLGKHVYCQKPMSRTIWEARLMATEAKRNGVATQMGNQAHAGEPIRRAVEWIRAGVIGKVDEVHCWTNRPIWPQGMTTRPTPQEVPDTLAWDLWLGPNQPVPYGGDAYLPFNWRGWWDFGAGALGDMGCHIMDMPFWALDLKYPNSVSADAEGNTKLAGPIASTITYRFPSNDFCNALKFVWYDGDRMPPGDVLDGCPEPVDQIPKKFDLVMIGEKGKMFFKRSSLDWAFSPASLLDDFQAPEPILPRVVDEDVEFLQACQGGPPALSNFVDAGPFTEVVLLGNLAVRLGKKIAWDGSNMKASNAPEADALIKPTYRKGWEL